MRSRLNETLFVRGRQGAKMATGAIDARTGVETAGAGQLKNCGGPVNQIWLNDRATF
jgi:hypothetical protein